MLTVIERQIRLYQLGYYNKITNKEITNDDLDGKWGSNSKKALRKFQKDNGLAVDGKYGPKSNAKLIKVYDNFMNSAINWNDPVLANFKESEFRCKHCGKNKIKKQLVYDMQALRHKLDAPIKIISGYRCYTHNKEVGGSLTSRHLQGKACDFQSDKTKTLAERKIVINWWVDNIPEARRAYCNGYANNQGKKSVVNTPNMGSSTHVDIK